jgi:Reverse transcriptase (RNA-dependent DNA polymerase)
MDNSKKRVLVVAASEALKDLIFKVVMDKEIAAFRENDCIEEIRLAHLEDNVNAVGTRWDFTIKKGMTETLFKARLVARGYEDAERENISSDSPVASAAAQRLVLAACAEHQWIPHSWDFSTAFLQGKYIDRKSNIVIAPPDGYSAAGIACRLKKPVYGLCSAPKFWYDRFREVATAAGLDCDVPDEAVFRLFDSTGSIIGILA